MIKDIANQTYGRLTVLRFAHVKGECAYWHCRCTCGTELICSGVDMRRGARTSCGCLKLETLTRIHVERKRVPDATRRCYKSWQNMINRCSNPSTTAYSRYGGRGIVVCSEWQAFEGFYRDMGNPPDGMEIERINNDGPYEPCNCRWATHLEQMRNCSINRVIEIGGQRRVLSEWLEETKLPRGTFYSRVARGWTDIEAISTPVGSLIPSIHNLEIRHE